MLKGVRCRPLPNYQRGAAARWDAYLYVPDPDALAAPNLPSRNVEVSETTKDTLDGLRGFELKDCDGYVLFSVVLGHECRMTRGQRSRIAKQS